VREIFRLAWGYMNLCTLGVSTRFKLGRPRRAIVYVHIIQRHSREVFDPNFQIIR